VVPVMGGFLRYLCFYCASHAIYTAVRNHQRRQAGARPMWREQYYARLYAPQRCEHGYMGAVCTGVAAGLLLLGLLELAQ
jgi:hypothetical protein